MGMGVGVGVRTIGEEEGWRKMGKHNEKEGI